jgi:aerobic carbon-monoxide dehydrogenase small subunit
MKAITLTLNGKSLVAPVEPRTHLADFLRETHGLTGTHLGCEHGICGACTLLLDGVPVRSCITYAIACDGAAVTTIEGLDDDEITKELRQAFSREHALQCGYCTPGMLVSARDLTLRAENANEHEIRVAMSGNLCRCTGYVGIVRAISNVIESRRTRGIAAIPDAGRRAIGPAGSGHPKTGGPPNLQRSGVTETTSTSRAAAETAGGSLASLRDFKPQATLTHDFVVQHPREDVWAFFERINEVAACLPGAFITGGDNRNVTGKMRIKVGPIAAEFDGVAVIDRDPSNYSGTIHGSGQDMRSASATRGSVSYHLVPGDDPRSTRVEVTVGYALTGSLAQFSRTDLMKDIVNRIAKGFAQNLEARLAAPGQAAPRPVAELNAGVLVFSIIVERVKGWLRKLISH